jgi:hypothetical protein
VKAPARGAKRPRPRTGRYGPVACAEGGHLRPSGCQTRPLERVEGKEVASRPVAEQPWEPSQAADCPVSACAPVAPERQTGCRPLHGPRSASGFESLPDNVIHSVRLEEGLQAFDARFAVGSE